MENHLPVPDETDVAHVQRIARETVELLRAMTSNVQITTGKVERAVADAIQRSELAKKVSRHEKKIAEHDSFIKRLSKQLTVSFSPFVHFDKDD